ncbi:hypothetical protein B0T26DRAFT_679630 [Lasiosphaeria miniovina]|uniref:Ankyrin repeat protein n=1 Tax=Lasiosphaeria miniovina TaxID=1954250 RepID=A0AA40DSH3_9PEZI|nr:uncharacterized protein B0T26DRAFT_679630 [Lasiosphaeria miniovina]KAK0710343.1 hypothetical protein B0T26DRAFT_679630 [Lasiosphaeria miniovina]
MDVWGPLNVSLDYRLRFSPTATDITHQLLDIICDTLLLSIKAKRVLTTVKPIDDRPPHITSRKRQRISVQGSSEVTRRSNYDTSDSESDVDPAEENILKVTETVGGTITRLFRLSNAVRRSAKANRARKIESYNDKDANKAIDELRLYTRCYIEFRFPEAPESLRSALVEANAWRLRRLYYQRSHRRRIDMSIQSSPTTPSVVQLLKMTGSAPTVRFAPSPLSKPETNNAPVRSPAPVTNATTARQTAVAALYAKSTTEVPRAKSCIYCGVIIEFKKTARSLLWHSPLYFDRCQGGGHRGGTGPLTFETSKAWSNHMQTAHGNAWECRAPSHDPIVFEQEIHYQEHSVMEHGVPEAHVGTLSRAARRPVLDKVLNCPFGDDFQPPDKVESSAVFSSEALQSHVAGHMKEIALLALQKLPSDDHENAENVDSDQPLENDGAAGVVGVARQSMYSVLEDEDLDFQDDDTGDVDDNPERHEEEISARVTELDLEDKDELGMTKLHHAVRADDLDLVESVIQSGASVDCRDENGSTPLHYAAGSGLVKCVAVLVEHGADIRITDNSGFSPFLWAIVAGHEDATAELLSMGADANSSSADGHSALAWAASTGRVSTAQMLLDRGASMHNARNTQQTTPLEEAAASGSLPIVELLIRRGADPNYRDRDGWSAIHWAAEEGHQEILLRGEVDPVKSTCHGWTALHHAAFMGHSRVVGLLLQDDRVRPTASLQDNHGWSVLHLAVHSRDLATVRILLDKSIIEDPQALVDESGLTAEEWLDRGPTSHSQKATNNLAFSKSRCCQAVTELRDAVAIGNAPLIRFLLKSGHYINGMNSGKRTALYYAAKKSMHSIMDLLLDWGADPNILPTGRKSWEEFISHDDVLQRLKLAGYRRRDTDPEVERQIRRALRGRSQPPEQPIPHSPEADKSPLFEPNNFKIRGPDGPSSPVPVSPTPPSLDNVASNKIPLSPMSTDQKNYNKRKARSGRTDWFKRLWGGRQMSSVSVFL